MSRIKLPPHPIPAKVFQREKAPVYTMGSADVRSFSRNKRGIAGSLVWVNFDRHALLDLVYKLKGQFVANVDDIRPSSVPTRTPSCRRTPSTPAPWSGIAARWLPPPSISSAASSSRPSPATRKKPPRGVAETSTKTHKNLFCTRCFLARSVAESAICCRPRSSEMPCKPRLKRLPATSRPGPGFPWFRLTGQVAGPAAD
jgi:hypothetical protein